MKLDNILDMVKKASLAEYKTAKSEKSKSQEKITTVSYGKDTSLYSGIEDTSMEKKSILDSFEELEKSDLDTQKDYMAILSNTVSSSDFHELMKEGYSLSDSEVEQIVTVVEKIKIKLAQAGVDTTYTKDVSLEDMEVVCGNTGQAVHIANELETNNLPATQENVSEISETMELASEIEELSDNAKKYMLTNNMEPTVTNLYRAEYSSSSVVNQKQQGYYSDSLPGYYAKKSQDFNWKAIEGQIQNIIKQAGLEVNETTIKAAKWIVENGVPLTEETIRKYMQLEEITLPPQPEELLQNIISSMKEGKRPKEVLLADNENKLEKAVQIQQAVESITDNAVKNVVQSGKELTIANLFKAQKTVEQNSDSTFIFKTGTVVEEDSVELISARRQLEELRLIMSVEASFRMLKQGIKVETTELSKLVEELKVEEKQYCQNLMEEKGIEPTESNIQLYQETNRKMTELAKMPMYALGKFVKTEQNPTVNEVHIHGMSVQASFENAKTSYETMMTTPRKDMGDSIQKAFRNVDSILKDLSLEITEGNQRAVKILAFNQMELTKENIVQVKQVDTCVNRLIKNMTGDVTLELIREGKNPLDTDIYSLNAQVEEIKEEIGSSLEEKYSEFLWKLEKNQGITQEERNAYIGIYRLFHQIEKSEGSVIGALVGQGAEITLRNLITSVKTFKSGGIKATVDDNFGGIKAVDKGITPMEEQINAGFDGAQSDSYYNEQQKQEMYYNILVKQVMENIDPEKLAHVRNINNYNISLENFAQQVQNLPVNEEIQQMLYQEKLNQVKNARMVENNVIKMLLNYEQPVTINNLVAAEGLMNERGKLIKRLMEQATKTSKKNKEKEILDAAERVTDRLISPEAAEAAYDELVQTESELVETAMEEETLNYVDIRSLKLLHQEIKLTGALSKEENYEIPVEINNEITSINLKIVRGSNVDGTVDITMECKKYGKIGASFHIKSDKITGLMVSDTQEGYSFLRSMDKNIKIGMAGDSYRVTKLNYAKSEDLDLNQFSETKKSDKNSKVNTVALYQCAKAFIGIIRENA
ncbi:MAG: hypothetical protein IJA36_02315 [Lachnospiraceae bacterium]|nr:hypothetical protein [Lachnospiraceae bacterium]